jgi:hypothetical protein
MECPDYILINLLIYSLLFDKVAGERAGLLTADGWRLAVGKARSKVGFDRGVIGECLGSAMGGLRVGRYYAGSRVRF